MQPSMSQRSVVESLFPICRSGYPLYAEPLRGLRCEVGGFFPIHVGKTRTRTLPVQAEARLVAMEAAFNAGSVDVLEERAAVSVYDSFPPRQVLGGTYVGIET